MYLQLATQEVEALVIDSDGHEHTMVSPLCSVAQHLEFVDNTVVFMYGKRIDSIDLISNEINVEGEWLNLIEWLRNSLR